MHARLIRTHTEALGAVYCYYLYVPERIRTLRTYKDIIV